ncbi:MAG TPA: phosphoribosyltransferase family protein [Candidatus Paceibacterota bacterium]|nr:phosphoribosyltransferase family protein [Candidatus Paceibacterota bacterium]
MWRDRSEAGKLLGDALSKYKNDKVVIFALPRGGVVVGYEVAKALKSSLDIIITRKIGHPSNSEYAICVVDERGSLLCNEGEAKSVDQKWLQEEIKRERSEAQRRITLFRGRRAPEEVKSKTAIIVDDGIATGFTIRLAVRSIKKQNPKKIIIAVPVAGEEALQELKKEGVDEIITLEPPEEFSGAVGAHYEQFEQVADDEVIRLIKYANNKQDV